MKHTILLWLMALAAGTTAQADTIPTTRPDSVAADTLSADTLAHRSVVKRVIDYFFHADRHADRKFDFGVIPGPHYSSTVGLGLGIVATGLYSLDRSDSTLQKSNVTLFTDVTTKGFLMMGVKGNNIFKKERYRLDYRLYVYTFPTLFWGIGYDNGNVDANETDYRRFKVEAMGRFLFRIAPKFYIGPMVNYQYVRASDIDAEGLPLFQGQRQVVTTAQAGFSMTYDTRDFILNAYRGWFLQLDQLFAPRFIGNRYCFSATELTASTYRRIWQGGILAGEWHSRFTYGRPAWCMLNDVGTTSRMRGYYEGRYRDKNIMELQVELRQHVWKRNGVAVWVGAGDVFPRFDALRWRTVLPNAGVGYRWAFKQRVNIRIDYGVTKNGGGFMFNINEAF
jgi:outer membrane protein assembly factor BamA